MLNTVGYRRAELIGQLGTVFSSEEALELKMVDKVVDSDLVMTEAIREMETWLQVPGLWQKLFLFAREGTGRAGGTALQCYDWGWFPFNQ